MKVVCFGQPAVVDSDAYRQGYKDYQSFDFSNDGGLRINQIDVSNYKSELKTKSLPNVTGTGYALAITKFEMKPDAKRLTATEGFAELQRPRPKSSDSMILVDVSGHIEKARSVTASLSLEFSAASDPKKILAINTNYYDEKFGTVAETQRSFPVPTDSYDFELRELKIPIGSLEQLAPGEFHRLIITAVLTLGEAGLTDRSFRSSPVEIDFYRDY